MSKEKEAVASRGSGSELGTVVNIVRRRGSNARSPNHSPPRELPPKRPPILATALLSKKFGSTMHKI